MSKCQLCRGTETVPLLNFGLQPICNRYLRERDAHEEKFPLLLSQCPRCGLVQLARTIQADELRPRYDWIRYTEPEPHLDALADRIASLPGLTRESSICGISFKDDSLLRRLRERGFSNTWRIGLRSDLGVSDRSAGVETVQEQIRSERCVEITNVRGKVSLVIARHILEHAHDVVRFVEGLKALLHPEGYLVLEVPDCTRAFEMYDYTTVWEEHILYFTAFTFRNFFPGVGLSLEAYECFPYALENSLIGIASVGGNIPSNDSQFGDLEEERERASRFASRFVPEKERWARYLSRYQEEEGRVALLGAGHLGCSFINFLDLSSCVDFVVDDDPNKHGLWMPGSRLPVRFSGALLEENIRFCLLSVNPEVEEKVILKNRGFLERGGRFSSIFPGSSCVVQR